MGGALGWAVGAEGPKMPARAVWDPCAQWASARHSLCTWLLRPPPCPQCPPSSLMQGPIAYGWWGNSAGVPGIACCNSCDP